MCVYAKIDINGDPFEDEKVLLKFRFSEKARKVWSLLQLSFDFTKQYQIKVKGNSKFVTFSENLNFNMYVTRNKNYKIYYSNFLF